MSNLINTGTISCIFGVDHRGDGVLVAFSDAIREQICTSTFNNDRDHIPSYTYNLALQILTDAKRCEPFSPFLNYRTTNQRPSINDLLTNASYPMVPSSDIPSWSPANIALDAMCAMTFLILAIQLLATTSQRYVSRVGLLSHRTYQLLCAWMMLHIAIQQGPHFFNSPLLAFGNKLGLCFVGLLLASYDWWISSSRSPHMLSPQQQQLADPPDEKNATTVTGEKALVTQFLLVEPAQPGCRTSDGNLKAVLPSASPAPIVLPWNQEQTPPSISAPRSIQTSPLERITPLRTHSDTSTSIQDDDPNSASGQSMSPSDMRTPQDDDATSRSNSVYSYSHSSLPDVAGHTGDVVTVSDGSHVVLSCDTGAVAVPSGVPVQAASSSLSHSRSLLKLAKAKLQKLDQDYTRSVEEGNQKATFMAFLCHELRNPLQVITANTDFLLEESHDSEEGASQTLTADQRELITSVNSSAELMLSIVNDVLDISRLQSGRMTFERLPIDLHFICHSILNISRSQAASKGLRLELHIDDSVPRFVISDPTRLHQLLLNLLSNAIKFTSEGGVTLTLRTATPTPEEIEKASRNRILHPLGSSTETNTDASSTPDTTGTDGLPKHRREGSDEDGNSSHQNPQVLIELEVKDTGVGIAEANISKLFQAYSQATISTQREHGGTGLGLSICRSIVAAMDGSIFVTSELGTGSTFHTRLFMEVCDDESIRRGMGTSGSYSDSPDLRVVTRKDEKRDARARMREKILIVDDHDINCKLLARMITSFGFTCEIAHDGIEAIQAIQTNMAEYCAKLISKGVQDPPPTTSFLCAFLDLNMPRLDGWGCLNRIRGELRLKEFPVIALTAESLEPSKLTEAGFTLSLSKPFRKPALATILEPIYESKQLALKQSGINSISPPPSGNSSASPSKSARELSSAPCSASCSPEIVPMKSTSPMLSDLKELSLPPLTMQQGMPPSPRLAMTSTVIDSALSSLHTATKAAESIDNSPSPSTMTVSRRLSPLPHSLNLSNSSSVNPPSREDTPRPDIPLIHNRLDSHLRSHSEFALNHGTSPPKQASKHTGSSMDGSNSTSSTITPTDTGRRLHTPEITVCSQSCSPVLGPRTTGSPVPIPTVSRLRGGGTHSPLGLTSSPRTVSRHLVIEPTSLPKKRPSRSSHIADSIVRISGYSSATSYNEETKRRRGSASRREESPIQVAPIPPLHPPISYSSLALPSVSPATSSMSPALSVSPRPSISPACSTEPCLSTTSCSSEDSRTGSTAGSGSTSDQVNSNSDGSTSSRGNSGDTNNTSDQQSSKAQRAIKKRGSLGRARKLMQVHYPCPSIDSHGLMLHRSKSDSVAVSRMNLSGSTTDDSGDCSSKSSSSSGCSSGSSSRNSSPTDHRSSRSFTEPRSACLDLKRHHHRDPVCNILVDERNAGMGRVFVPDIASPPVLRAPPCTPASPQPSPTQTLPQSYPRPFPVHLFKGRQELERATPDIDTPPFAKQ